MTKPADFWNERYQRDDYIFGTEANDFIRAMTPYPSPGMKAFAPADGEGRNGVFLARMGYAVTSVDVSALAVDKAHKLADAHGVEINAHVGDVFDHAKTASDYDLVIISFMHFLPQDHDRFIRLVRDCLKPGGLVIMENYTIDQIPLTSGGPKNEDMLLTRGRVEADFDGFDIEILRENRRFLAEGPRHQGEAAVIQLVARKPTT
ncbi:MAG: class I SAM-dependent methyltransferase [Candidatus Puniceispirillales bacterium]